MSARCAQGVRRTRLPLLCAAIPHRKRSEADRRISALHAEHNSIKQMLLILRCARDR